MRTGFLGLWMLVLTAPAVVAVDPDDPAPSKSEKVPAAAQEPTAPAQIPEKLPQPAPTSATDAQQQPAATTPTQAPAQSKLIDCHDGPPEHWWVDAEYLLWWLKSGPLPQPLLQTGTIDVDGNVVPGDVLGGNSTLDYGRASGVRIGGGGWLGERHIWGLEASGFVLEQKTVRSSFASDANGNPLLIRPINDALNDFGPEAVFVAAPDTFSGSFSLSSSSRLWGTEANVLRNLYASPRFRADLLLGFRYLDLEENLNLVQQTQALAGGELFFLNDPTNPNPPIVNALSIFDGFHTRNQVYAGQIGLRFEGHAGSAFFRVTTKVGFGPNHETVTIAGSTTATLMDPNTLAVSTQTATGGLLALPGTNIGKSTDNPFVIVPQVDLRVGWQATSRLQLYFGYDFLYINDVVRPGSQVNLNVNTGLVPSSSNFNTGVGPNEPSRLTKKDEFWAQGINFGIEFRY
jgi:hypothetical protein